MNQKELYTLGIDIGSTTVKIAILDENNEVVFSDYERHFANIQETLSDLLGRAIHKLGPVHASPVITLEYHSYRKLSPYQLLFRTMHLRQTLLSSLAGKMPRSSTLKVVM